MKKITLATTLKDLLPSKGKKMTEQQVIDALVKMGIWDPKARGVRSRDLTKAGIVTAAKLEILSVYIADEGLEKEDAIGIFKLGQMNPQAKYGESGENGFYLVFYTGSFKDQTELDDAVQDFLG